MRVDNGMDSNGTSGLKGELRDHNCGFDANVPNDIYLIHITTYHRAHCVNILLDTVRYLSPTNW